MNVRSKRSPVVPNCVHWKGQGADLHAFLDSTELGLLGSLLFSLDVGLSVQESTSLEYFEKGSLQRLLQLRWCLQYEVCDVPVALIQYQRHRPKPEYTSQRIDQEAPWQTACIAVIEISVQETTHLSMGYAHWNVVCEKEHLGTQTPFFTPELLRKGHRIFFVSGELHHDWCIEQ